MYIILDVYPIMGHLLPLPIIEVIGTPVRDKIFLQCIPSVVRVGFALTLIHAHFIKYAADVVTVLVAQIIFMLWKKCRTNFVFNLCIPRLRQDICLPPAPIDTVNIVILSALVTNGVYNCHFLKDIRLTSIGNLATA